MTFAADSEALIEGAPLGDWRVVRLHRFIGQQMKEKLFCFVGVIVMLVNGRWLSSDRDLASWMQFVKLGETSTGLYTCIYTSTC